MIVSASRATLRRAPLWTAAAEPASIRRSPWTDGSKEVAPV